VINKLGVPGVLVHGVNIRPGKPTILAVCDGKPVVGLPGNPVSAYVISNLFVRPIIQRMLGMDEYLIFPSTQATLLENVNSVSGREDWVPVNLTRNEQSFSARPIFGKSNFIFDLVRADGLLKIPTESTGFGAGSQVLIYQL
jgi:molybdopterin molybdotransferase